MHFAKTLKLILLSPFLFLLFFTEIVHAHCPLCTVGAMAAAGGAAWLGVNKAVIGIFIGAFAVSTGWWIANLLKKKYIPFQKPFLIILSFATIVIPILPMPVMESNYPLYLSFAGDYGSLLNRTYVINLFFAGSILGSIIVCITPWLSKKISEIGNGKLIPFQGILLTFILLIIAGISLQLALGW
ncbi:hypothetical protein HYX01_00105 [Candidatus Woesearchaeota archaeon]|nr:hypothetical protein [Candidatus Woesearchaeota archaeon]